MPQIETIASAGLITGWLVATAVGIIYASGAWINPASCDVAPSLSVSMERLGRFILFSLPIAPLCLILATLYRRRNMSLSQAVPVVAVPCITAVTSAIISAFIGELGLATQRPLPGMHQVGATFASTHAVVKFGTMHVLYPPVTLLLAVLLAPPLAKHLRNQQARRLVVAWIASGVASLTVAALAVWSIVWPGPMFAPGSGIGIVVVLASLAVSIPAIVTLVWRDKLAETPEKGIAPGGDGTH